MKEFITNKRLMLSLAVCDTSEEYIPKSDLFMSRDLASRGNIEVSRGFPLETVVHESHSL